MNYKAFKRGLSYNIIILLLTAIMLTTTLLISFQFINNKPKEVKAVTIGVDGTVAELYKKNTIFEINTFDALQSFSNYCYASVYTWAGKTIKLTADIDCGGEELKIGPTNVGNQYGGANLTPIFSGTFDGQNYTITNFVIATATKSLVGYSMSGTGGGYAAGVSSAGMFSVLGSSAIVKNLKLKDFKTTVTNIAGGSTTGGGTTSYVVAGLAGYAENGAQIYNCSVENFTHQALSGKVPGYSYMQYLGSLQGLSGIIAAGYGTISNCYVENVITTGTSPITGVGPAVTKVTAGQNSYSTFKSSISNCISKNAIVSSLSTTNSYNTANQTSGLSCSSTGGSSGTTWYYTPEFNGGYPYLRQFIPGWSTYNFRAGSNGKVSASSFTIPSTETISFNKNSATNLVLGQEITATPNEGYDFDNWTQSGTTYTANFKIKTFTLTFTNVTNTTNDASASYTLAYGTEIRVSYQKSTNTIKYVFADNTVTYKIVSNIYTVDEYGTVDNATNVTIKSNLTITPSVKYKEYSQTWQ